MFTNKALIFILRFSRRIVLVLCDFTCSISHLCITKNTNSLPMTKKDFFSIVIKLFGLYSVIKIVFGVLPGNISFALYGINLVGVLWLLAALAITIGLFILLLFKTETIIRWFKLDKGFDDNMINISNFNAEKLLSLGLIIIGGLLVINNTGAFLSQTLLAFKTNIPEMPGSTSIIKFTQSSQYIAWGTSFINILIGFLLLTNFQKISQRIGRINHTKEPLE